MKILLVEDDPALARTLQVSLGAEGYSVRWASTLEEAFEFEKRENLVLVLLDLGLNDGSGLDFLKTIRDQASRLPIIILTARTDEDSVVEGLRAGANDYVRKPFGQRELLARIQSILREPQLREDQMRCGNLLILLEQRIVKYNDKPVELNRREFDLLRLLVQKKGAVVARETIINHIDKEGEIFDRTVDSHISHLRGRLRAAGVREIKITSVYGIGYRLETY